MFRRGAESLGSPWRDRARSCRGGARPESPHPLPAAAANRSL